MQAWPRPWPTTVDGLYFRSFPLSHSLHPPRSSREQIPFSDETALKTLKAVYKSCEIDSRFPGSQHVLTFCLFVNLFVRTFLRRGGELVILFVPFLYPVSSHMDGFRPLPLRPSSASHGSIFVVLHCGRKGNCRPPSSWVACSPWEAWAWSGSGHRASKKGIQREKPRGKVNVSKKSPTFLWMRNEPKLYHATCLF